MSGVRVVEQVAEVIQARRRQRRRRRTLRLLLASGALVALFLFLSSELFVVRNLTITGLERMTPAEVQAKAGLPRQVLVWQVWPWRVERQLRSHPRVASARVSISLPNRVRIAVTERQPVAVFITGGGKSVEVDADGRVLAVWSRAAVPPGPLVTGLALANPLPGQRLTRADALLAVRVAAGLGPAARARVSEINLDAGGEVRLYTLEGVPVFLGIDETWAEKGKTLLAALSAVPDARQLAYVDLRSVKRPVIRLKQPLPAAADEDRPTAPVRGPLNRLPPELGGLP